MREEDELFREVRGLQRLPSLDGWRGLSIGLVLAAHSKVTADFPEEALPVLRWLPDGGFGVQFFFVISGFLITWLLLKERERTGGVSLTAFFWRRSIRILPVYVAFLAVLVALSKFTPFSMSTNSWAAMCTYTVNYVRTPWTGSHVWSLSIEEQFYIVWPFVFILLAREKVRLRWMLGALAIPILTFPLFRIMGYITHYEHCLLRKYSFLLKGDAIAIGCVGAVVLWCSPAVVKRLVEGSRGILALAVVLILIPHVLTRQLLLGPLTVPLGPTMSSVGICLLVLQSILRPKWFVYSLLQLAPLAWLGTLSYSVYVWQQIFCTDPAVFGFSKCESWFSFPLWLVSTFLVAIASHYLVERPCLKMKSMMPRRVADRGGSKVL